MELDKKVYKEEYRISKETTLKALKTNPYTDIIIKDNENLVGYISLMPIPLEMYQKIHKNNFIEEEVENSIVPYDHMGRYNAYLTSIVIDKENYPRFTGKHLFKILTNHIKKIRKRGIFIENIIAYTVSPMGRKTVRNMKFKEVNKNIFSYSCKRQGLDFGIKEEVISFNNLLFETKNLLNIFNKSEGFL